MGKANHPQTQGKIERYHGSKKNVIKLDNYYSPDELGARLAEFIDYLNNHRYHESFNNLTTADVYFGRGRKILEKREKIILEKIKRSSSQHLKRIFGISA